MAAYIVATMRIHDPEGFAAYVAAVGNLRAEFGGETLVRGPVAEVLEGEVQSTERVVVLRFPDVASARAFYRSQRYQDARRLRQGAAIVEMRIVED